MNVNIMHTQTHTHTHTLFYRQGSFPIIGTQKVL